MAEFDFMTYDKAKNILENFGNYSVDEITSAVNYVKDKEEFKDILSDFRGYYRYSSQARDFNNYQKSLHILEGSYLKGYYESTQADNAKKLVEKFENFLSDSENNSYSFEDFDQLLAASDAIEGLLTKEQKDSVKKRAEESMVSYLSDEYSFDELPEESLQALKNLTNKIGNDNDKEAFDTLQTFRKTRENNINKVNNILNSADFENYDIDNIADAVNLARNNPDIYDEIPETFYYYYIGDGRAYDFNRYNDSLTILDGSVIEDSYKRDMEDRAYKMALALSYYNEDENAKETLSSAYMLDQLSAASKLYPDLLSEENEGKLQEIINKHLDGISEDIKQLNYLSKEELLALQNLAKDNQDLSDIIDYKLNPERYTSSNSIENEEQNESLTEEQDESLKFNSEYNSESPNASEELGEEYGDNGTPSGESSLGELEDNEGSKKLTSEQHKDAAIQDLLKDINLYIDLPINDGIQPYMPRLYSHYADSGLRDLCDKVEIYNDKDELITEGEKQRRLEVLFDYAKLEASEKLYEDKDFVANNPDNAGVLAEEIEEVFINKLIHAGLVSNIDNSKFKDNLDKAILRDDKKLTEYLEDFGKGKIKIKEEHLINACADTDVKATSFKDKVEAKVGKGKSEFRKILNSTREKAHAIWGERFAISRNIAKNIKENKWQHIANTGATLAMVGLSATGVGTAAVIGYSAYSAIGNYVWPLVPEAKKLREEAKSQGQKLSYLASMRQAFNNKKNEPAYKNRRRFGLIAAAVGGVAGGVAFSNVAQSKAFNALARASASVSAQFTTAVAAQKAYNKAKKDEAPAEEIEVLRKEKNNAWTSFGVGAAISVGVSTMSINTLANNAEVDVTVSKPPTNPVDNTSSDQEVEVNDNTRTDVGEGKAESQAPAQAEGQPTGGNVEFPKEYNPDMGITRAQYNLLTKLYKPEDLNNMYNNLSQDGVMDNFNGMTKEEVLFKYQRLDAWTDRVDANGNSIQGATRYHFEDEMTQLNNLINCGKTLSAEEYAAVNAALSTIDERGDYLGPDKILTNNIMISADQDGCEEGHINHWKLEGEIKIPDENEVENVVPPKQEVNTAPEPVVETPVEPVQYTTEFTPNKYTPDQKSETVLTYLTHHGKDVEGGQQGISEVKCIIRDGKEIAITSPDDLKRGDKVLVQYDHGTVEEKAKGFFGQTYVGFGEKKVDLPYAPMDAEALSVASEDLGIQVGELTQTAENEFKKITEDGIACITTDPNTGNAQVSLTDAYGNWMNAPEDIQQKVVDQAMADLNSGTYRPLENAQDYSNMAESVKDQVDNQESLANQEHADMANSTQEKTASDDLAQTSPEQGAGIPENNNHGDGIEQTYYGTKDGDSFTISVNNLSEADQKDFYKKSQDLEELGYLIGNHNSNVPQELTRAEEFMRVLCSQAENPQNLQELYNNAVSQICQDYGVELKDAGNGNHQAILNNEYVVIGNGADDNNPSQQDNMVEAPAPSDEETKKVADMIDKMNLDTASVEEGRRSSITITTEVDGQQVEAKFNKDNNLTGIKVDGEKQDFDKKYFGNDAVTADNEKAQSARDKVIFLRGVGPDSQNYAHSGTPRGNNNTQPFVRPGKEM